MKYQLKSTITYSKGVVFDWKADIHLEYEPTTSARDL